MSNKKPPPPSPDLPIGTTPSIVGSRPKAAPETAPAPPVGLTIQQVADAQAKSKSLEEKVEELERELTSKHTSDKRILDLQKELTKLLEEKRTMEDELVALRRKVMSQEAPTKPTRIAGLAQPQPDESASARTTINVIDPSAAAKAGLPKLTTFPNVVSGIVKDNVGSLLPGVLVTIRDKDDVPLRAFKTNKLGQFVASTSLPSGTYLVEIEDPRSRYVFDRAQIVVAGVVMPPLEIVAKSHKEIERAKLAQQIFGDKPT